MKASPLAKKLAEDRGLSLGLIPGSGEGGRIVKRDVEAFVGGGSSAATAVERFTEVGVSQMRKTIARRLAESKFTAPHFYLSLAIDMDAADGPKGHQRPRSAQSQLQRHGRQGSGNGPQEPPGREQQLVGGPHSL